MSDLSGMFRRYSVRNRTAEAAMEQWFWPHVRQLSQAAVAGTGCCRACWHAYRRSEVVVNPPADGFISEQFDVEERESLDLPEGAVARLRLAGDGPDPVGLSRLVRELVPGAECSPNYVLQIANHPVLFPHFLPRPEPPPDTPKAAAASPVSVAVLDTGCIDDHSWWQNQVTPATEYPPDPARPETIVSGHGTFIVGMIRKLAPEVHVVAHQLPLGAELNEFRVAAGLLAAGQAGVAVINVSLGVCALDGLPPVAMAAAVDALDRRFGDDLTIVAAAGNDGVEHVVYPAAFPSVIGVAAVDNRGRRSGYSNFGSWVRASAVGAAVSTYFGERATETIDPLGSFDGYAAWEGTSFAAPVVAARIASEVAAGGRARPSAGTVLGRSGVRVVGAGMLVH
jgi:hypothetical protein